MEIRDPVHGSIQILDAENDVISDPFFQRLRNIKQLGFSEYIFPGATHTRFIHSIGVMHIGEKIFNKLFKKIKKIKKLDTIKETFKMACLLHDTGHAPLSHSTEIAMPMVKDLKLPKRFEPLRNRQATHEDYTIKIITDSSLEKSFTNLKKIFNINSSCIAELIIGKQSKEYENYFRINNINYFNVLHQLVSSELDCDRMDYLLRDSYFCGVSYGQFDIDWLIDNLSIVISKNGTTSLGISERSVVTFDDFLLSRYHMFIMVYFHYKSVCLEQLLYKYFKTSPLEYKIPQDINQYLNHDDNYLLKKMKSSNNKFAKMIIKNQIPPKIFESFNLEQKIKLEKCENILKKYKIEYIRSSSASRLSKYINPQIKPKKKDVNKLLVVRSEYLSENTLSYPIEQATQLFSKFSQSHEINRLHCDFSILDIKTRKQIIKELQDNNLNFKAMVDI